MRLLSPAEPSIIASVRPAAAVGAPRLAVARGPVREAALAGFFSDFTLERGRLCDDMTIIAAWAETATLARQRTSAAARGLPFIALGQGLLRTPPRGRLPRPSLSLCAIEIAGPASAADRLSAERVLARRGWESPQLLRRAASAREALVRARIGGGWWDTGAEHALPRGDGYALVAIADRPVAGSDPALARAASEQMVQAALDENRPDRVVVFAPARAQRGPLGRTLEDAAARGATVITQPVDAWTVLDRAERVYTVGGETGFLALLAGRDVRCFGPAFYTGWGATDDDRAAPRRPFDRSIDEIFAGACLLATRYLDPFRNTQARFEDTLALLADWRRIDTANRRIAVCVGMSFWKRRRVAEFAASSAGAPVFRRTAQAAVAAARGTGAEPPRAIAVWASRIPAGLPDAAARDGIPLIRVEDGFVRSVGLGADFLPPASLVFDAGGMYYDPRSESDLETLLRESEFTPDLIARAERLAEQLVARGITKYNLGGNASAIALPPDRRSILVPGQVEDDLSILSGGGEIRGNLALLREARRENPDAFILYKPHPDVLAGYRKGAVPAAETRRVADAVVQNVSTAALLDRIDELHTMTSLAGFEALLRRRRVVVYGRPFYAGWGLTEDRCPIDRGRRLSLEELVAGVLILYPRYLDPLTRLPCGPEVIIERLERPELWRAGALVRARRLQGALARRLNRFRSGLR